MICSTCRTPGEGGGGERKKHKQILKPKNHITWKHLTGAAMPRFWSQTQHNELQWLQEGTYVLYIYIFAFGKMKKWDKNHFNNDQTSNIPFRGVLLKWNAFFKIMKDMCILGISTTVTKRLQILIEEIQQFNTEIISTLFFSFSELLQKHLYSKMSKMCTHPWLRP